MTVYVVVATQPHHGWVNVSGTFTTRLQAERYIERLKRQLKYYYTIFESEVDEQVARIVNVPISKLRMSGRFDPYDIESLEQDIKENGLLVPIMVKERARTYVIFNGNRRLHVCRRLGFTTVNVLIME